MKTDNALKRDVENELNWEPSVNEAHIGVSAKNGVIMLAGHVSTYGEKYGAEKAAKRVSGVRGVANELAVKLAGDKSRSDEDLASACVAALRANAAIPEGVKAVVQGGWVRLEGTVDWQYQKTAADRAIRYLGGIVGLTDDIVVTPRASASDVKDKIEAALKRSAEIDASHIKVDLDGSTVRLHGTVRSWAEKDQAMWAAWSAPGVTTVDNELAITM